MVFKRNDNLVQAVFQAVVQAGLYFVIIVALIIGFSLISCFSWFHRIPSNNNAKAVVGSQLEHESVNVTGQTRKFDDVSSPIVQRSRRRATYPRESGSTSPVGSVEVSLGKVSAVKAAAEGLAEQADDNVNVTGRTRNFEDVGKSGSQFNSPIVVRRRRRITIPQESGSSSPVGRTSMLIDAGSQEEQVSSNALSLTGGLVFPDGQPVRGSFDDMPSFYREYNHWQLVNKTKKGV